MDHGIKINRRTFLKAGALAGTSLIARPLLGRIPPPTASAIYVARSSDMFSPDSTRKRQTI